MIDLANKEWIDAEVPPYDLVNVTHFDRHARAVDYLRSRNICIADHDCLFEYRNAETTKLEGLK